MFKNLSFKLKLILMILALLVLSVGVFGYLTITGAAEDQTETIFTANYDLAQALSEDINQNLLALEDKMLMLSQIINLSDTDGDEIIEIINYHVENDPLLSEFSYLDENRNVEFSTASNWEPVEDTYINQAFSEGSAYSTIYPRSDNYPTLQYARYHDESIIIADINLEHINQIVDEYRPGETGYAALVNSTGKLFAHPDRSLVYSMEDISNTTVVSEYISGKESGYTEYEFDGTDRLGAFGRIPEVEWGAIVNLHSEEAMAGVTTQIRTGIITALIILVLGGMAAYFIGNRITRPILKAVSFSEEVAAGRLNQENLDIDREDEIGRLANALNIMQEELQDMIKEIIRISEELSSSGQELSASSDELGRAAEEVSESIQDVASGAEEQTAQIQETTSSIEQMSNGVDNIEKTAKEMDDTSEKVVSRVQDGNQAVKETQTEIETVRKDAFELSEMMKELGELSNEINDIVDMISEISNQTNLLALNAAIEAARAGEAGRGFSVVADEIRELAEESAQSTDKINQLVMEVQAGVKEAINKVEENVDSAKSSSENMDQTRDIFNNISSSIKELDNFIEEVADNTAEMADYSGSITSSTQGIASVSEESAANAEEVAASSEEQLAATEEISSGADRLATIAERLAARVNKFDI